LIVSSGSTAWSGRAFIDSGDHVVQVLELRNVSKRFGEALAVDNVSFSVAQGGILALLGPSGCGKTTTLRLIAGFETPDIGELLVEGQDISGKRPYERNVGLLFQDYALFPHMTVAENVAYGLRFRGFNSRDAKARTEEMLALVKLSGYASRRPSQLSGGEQQRIALARALAINPKVVLLDEPLSALDAKLRQELRTEIKDILTRVGATTVIVTHDQEEAFGIAERVIVMNRGVIAQEGSPAEIYLAPNNRFVAEFIGRSNLLKGAISSIDSSRARFVGDGIELKVSAGRMSREAVWVCVRPERIAVQDPSSKNGSTESYENVLEGVVVDCAPLAADVHLLVALKSGQRIAVVEKNIGQPAHPRGAVVSLCFNVDDCVIVTS
jgi:putative spermidine/putrescine transport system ATP-binding protein/putrescine transport system ATP-binding protein